MGNQWKGGSDTELYLYTADTSSCDYLYTVTLGQTRRCAPQARQLKRAAARAAAQPLAGGPRPASSALTMLSGVCARPSRASASASLVLQRVIAAEAQH